MRFSYNWLKEYIVNLPKPEIVADILTRKSFEVEEIIKLENDYALNIKLSPDRFPDCSGHIGLAKEICALLNLKFKEPKIIFKEAKKKTNQLIKVKLENKTDCLRYCSRIIQNIQIKPSPKLIKERLETCGMQSINNIVDASNYVMLETGQPLHCFDYDSIAKDKTIIIRRAKNKERMETLDHKMLELTSDVLLIADSQKISAIAGIKGGVSTGISDTTKTIILESANFDPAVIRQSSKTINLITDASIRFEKGISLDLTKYAINRLAQLIQQIGEGEILGGIVDACPKKPSKKILGFNLKQFQTFAGFAIPTAEIQKIFQRLHFKILKKNKETIFIEAPAWRLDIEMFGDLAEEILRIYDYNKIPATPPQGIIIPPEKNDNVIWKRKIRKTLTSLGVNEVYNYSFVSEKDLENFYIKKNEVIPLKNPISSEYAFLRPTLIANLLKNSSSNLRFFDEVKIFEIGKTFQSAPIYPHEEWRLAGLISRKNKKDNPFLELKGILEKLFQSFGVWDVEFHNWSSDLWLIKGRAAEIKIGNESLGIIGEISPELAQKYTDEFATVIFEMDLEKIITSINEELEYEPLSKFPAVIRDISMVVNNETSVAEILNIINDTENKILRNVDLFDIYEGENLGNAKKSLSFHLIFQSETNTLTNEEVGRSLEKIISALKDKINAEIR